MVTCHDLGTDKTLLYSAFGAGAISIKCTAFDVPTVIYHLTNLLLLALGGEKKQHTHKKKTTTKHLRAQSNSIKTEGNMPLGLQ